MNPDEKTEKPHLPKGRNEKPDSRVVDRIHEADDTSHLSDVRHALHSPEPNHPMPPRPRRERA